MKQVFRNPRTDLPWLVMLHMIAFVGFHATVEFNASLWFRQLTYGQNEWLGTLVGVGGFWFWTLGFTIYFAWLAVVSKRRRLQVVVCFLFAAYSFHTYRYPVATAMLTHFDHFDQFERIGYLVLNQDPPFSEVAGFSLSKPRQGS